MKILILSVFFLCFSAKAQTITETFGSGTNAFSIEFVTIGNPGNAPDTGTYFNTATSYSAGSVAYTYHLGKYEISRGQIDSANMAGGLGITLDDMTVFGGNGLNRPATGISWFEAAKFVNYLNTSQGKQVAYRFDGSGNFQLWGAGQYNGTNQYRHKDAFYFLPSKDEWYKGAYGSPSGVWYDFPTASNYEPLGVSGGTAVGTAVYKYQLGPADVTDAGGLSSYGTMGQGGNVWEWSESGLDGVNDSLAENRVMRGGSWDNHHSYTLSATDQGINGLPSLGASSLGFRVASMPEPSSLSLLLAGGAVLMAGRRRKSD